MLRMRAAVLGALNFYSANHNDPPILFPLTKDTTNKYPCSSPASFDMAVYSTLDQLLSTIRSKSRILPPNLNNNWMTAVIGRSRHVTGWATLRLVGGRIPDLHKTQRLSCMGCTWKRWKTKCNHLVWHHAMWHPNMQYSIFHFLFHIITSIQWRMQRGGGAATPLPFRVTKKKRPDFGQNMFQNVSFDASDFNFFGGACPQAPLQHIRGWLCQLWWV